ncbi:PPE family protein [Mycobacterium malmoense]|uniref:PPE family protein n=1 Tax=Mycobacterium malmoense TaxID=1780 RepID=A0ABX3SVR7_MYCMA|nr:PPE family protein [Mycobacterium malmoense]ORA84683.1 PPE family protein [Mycobacterium malmoense]QZA15621.1 PPE family protein [Mycobacterium malmoense]UNB92435.1 PPE family protein [Mycobacterium malmoense]
MDYGMLPPEINSGRMYAGAGSGPLVAAAAAWDGLTTELNFAASSYRAAVSELTSGPWVGPSSTTMAAAADPYMSWMSATATRAEQTATQLKSAVAAYEAAFMATVPPPEIEVNRALLASLVATNILGQNTPAIAATEAQYAEMWAQDAAAMYGYAGASAAATRLTAFVSPPQTTNPAGATTQAAAATAGPSAQSALSAVPSALQSLSSAAAVDPITWLENLLGGPTGAALNNFSVNFGNLALTVSGFLFVASGITPFMGGLYGLLVPGAMAAAAADIAPDAGLGALVGSYDSVAGLDGAGVSAGLGEAASVGTLSVPRSWTSPAIRLAAGASPLPSAGLDGFPQTVTAESGGFVGGIPPVGSLVNAPRGEQTRGRFGSGQKVVPAMPGESGADAHTPVQPAPPQRPRQHVASALSEREREELDKLRKEIAEAAMERDAAARLIKEAML